MDQQQAKITRFRQQSNRQIYHNIIDVNNNPIDVNVMNRGDNITFLDDKLILLNGDIYLVCKVSNKDTYNGKDN